MPAHKTGRPPVAKPGHRIVRRPVVNRACFDPIDAGDGMPPLPGEPWAYEKTARADGHRRIAGIDEAGRGPLAGPVVAAAVILPEHPCCGEVADSKQLSPVQREGLYETIYAQAVTVGIGIVDAVEIDRINILRASLLAMAMAVANLDPAPDCLLVDGTFPIPLPLTQRAIVRGDALSPSIAAASVVAKVTRDRLMGRYDQDFPVYGFAIHKGYATLAHREAIRRHGCCPIHRRSFRGVKASVLQTGARQLSLTGGDG